VNWEFRYSTVTDGQVDRRTGMTTLIFALRNFANALNPLKAELFPMCYLLALLGAHHFLHVSRIRVKSLTLRLIMSYIYIYMERLFLMFLDHTQRRTAVGRTPLDEWSAHRRDLYLTTHDTHNRQISMLPVVHGYLSVVIVVCCQVEVSTTSWSLVQRSPTDCGASLCVI